MINVTPNVAKPEFHAFRILIAGTARNCEKSLRKDVFTLYNALRGCHELYWLVIESDSSDNTVYELQAISSQFSWFQYVSLGNLVEVLPIRSERVAHCRNVYLDELRLNPLYARIDYLVIADLDGTNDLVTADGFASCWKRTDWGVCTANQDGPYYDIFALRHSIWSPNDYFQQFQFLRRHKIEPNIAIWAALYSKMITIGRAQDWIEVDSAFGGLAIYCRKAVEGVSYFGVDDKGIEVCEHVSLNKQIRDRGYKIYINPGLVNTSINSHNSGQVFAECMLRYILGLVRILDLLRRAVKTVAKIARAVVSRAFALT